MATSAPSSRFQSGQAGWRANVDSPTNGRSMRSGGFRLSALLLIAASLLLLRRGQDLARVARISRSALRCPRRHAHVERQGGTSGVDQSGGRIPRRAIATASITTRYPPLKVGIRPVRFG